MLVSHLLRPTRLIRPVLPSAARFNAFSTPSSNRARFFSQTASRPAQHDDYQARLRNARPLVPDAIADRLNRAGRVRYPKAYMAAAAVAAVAFYLYNSQTVPVTGRRRFNFLSDRFVAWTHKGAADVIIREVQSQGGRFLSDRDRRTVLVKRVMKRLIPVSGMAGLDWEIFVIEDRGMRPYSCHDLFVQC